MRLRVAGVGSTHDLRLGQNRELLPSDQGVLQRCQIRAQKRDHSTGIPEIEKRVPAAQVQQLAFPPLQTRELLLGGSGRSRLRRLPGPGSTPVRGARLGGIRASGLERRTLDRLVLGSRDAGGHRANAGAPRHPNVQRIPELRRCLQVAHRRAASVGERHGRTGAEACRLDHHDLA